MTSWEFAKAHPLLTEAEAVRIVREDLGPERFTTAAELLGWLGY